MINVISHYISEHQVSPLCCHAKPGSRARKLNAQGVRRPDAGAFSLAFFIPFD
jgi:hypothetical protein